MRSLCFICWRLVLVVFDLGGGQTKLRALVSAYSPLYSARLKLSSRLLHHCNKFTPITPIMRDLHWLPIECYAI